MDLFGEEPELNSGDDLERDDHLSGSEDGAQEDGAQEDGEQENGEQMDVINTMPADLGVHPTPQPTDGELYLLKVPKFLAFDPVAFEPEHFQPPTTDLHSKVEASADFSAYKAAMNTVRWQKSATDPSKLQSNARILRWSDGSLTLQLANDPATQYLVPGNALAPPQHNPSKPTPTSTGGIKPKGFHKPVPYSADKDAFTYLAAPSEHSALLRITNKITTGLQVELSKDASEEAVQRLRDRIEASQQETHAVFGDASNLSTVELTEDPELGKKRAELAEKERMRAQRKRENQEMKNGERTGRTLGRRGAGTGLSAGALELGDDELGAGVSRRTGAAPRRAQPKRSRRGEIYSDDEEAWGARGRTKEDEYDEEDDFVARSDEEEELAEEEDEDIDEGIELDQGRPRKRASPQGDEQDAEGESDDDDQDGRQTTRAADGSPTSRTKRRRVVDDEDEE